jgi:hypothetical protein
MLVLFPSSVFQSDVLRAQACQIICTRFGLKGMWDDSGPTDQARKMIKDWPHNGLSLGPQTAFRSAWAIWDQRSGNLTLSEIILNLEGKYLMPLASLLMAIAKGSTDVEKWIAQNINDETIIGSGPAF